MYYLSENFGVQNIIQEPVLKLTMFLLRIVIVSWIIVVLKSDVIKKKKKNQRLEKFDVVLKVHRFLKISAAKCWLPNIKQKNSYAAKSFAS